MSEEVVQTQEAAVIESVEPAEVVDSFEPSTVDTLFGGVKESPEVAETQAITPEVKPETKAEEKPPEPEIDPKAVLKERDGFKTAMMEERRKRQEYEAKLAALEEVKHAPPENLYIDEEVKTYYEKENARKASEYQKQLIAATTELAREVYKDYDDVIAVFAERAKDDGTLLNEVMAAKNPAKAAYDKGKRFMIEKQYGTDDPVMLEKKIKESIRAELQKEIREELMGKAAAQSKQPTRLSKLASSGGAQETEWKPTSVNSLFGRR